MEEKDLAGYCGLYCGLCVKFQSRAKSRCPGCRVAESSAYCSIYNCATKKKAVDSCATCGELPSCKIFQRREVLTWPTVKVNLDSVAGIGLEAWLEDEKQKRVVVEELLENYNDGRSMTFFCKSVSRIPLGLVRDAIRQVEVATRAGDLDKRDIKGKAGTIRSILQEIADSHGISLK